MRPHLGLGDPAGHCGHRAVDDARAARGDGLAHAALDPRRTERQLRQPRVGETHRLQPPHPRGVARKPVDPNLFLDVNDLLQPHEKPGIEAGDLVDPLDREALAQRFRRNQQPVGRRPRQRARDLGRVGALEGPHAVEAGEARLEPAQRLLQALGEVTADRHHLADRLHRGRQ